MHKSPLIILFILCTVNGLHAQQKSFEYVDSTLLQPRETQEENDGEAMAVETKRDNTLYINPVNFPRDTIQQWKNEKAFAYVRNLDSLLKAKQQEDLEASKKVDDYKSSSFFQKLWSLGILQLLFWTVAISFVIFIVYRLFLSNGIFKKNTVSRQVNEVIPEITITRAEDYDKLIRQAYKLEDYRLAVRYIFLKLLLNLYEKEYLQQSVDKTNFQYSQEIEAGKRVEFSALVLNYEYVWYGNLKISREQFDSIEKKFIGFNNKI